MALQPCLVAHENYVKISKMYALAANDNTQIRSSGTYDKQFTLLPRFSESPLLHQTIFCCFPDGQGYISLGPIHQSYLLSKESEEGRGEFFF